VKIAVVGSGIAGLTAAHLLSRKHDVILYEADSRIGGHTHTHSIDDAGRRLNIDTGFIVFNHKTYPNFTKLLSMLGVESRESSMSFSVRCERTGLEYNGTSLATLFAKKRNAINLRFLGMLMDIVRFNKESTEASESSLNGTLGEFLKSGGYSRYFRDYYIVPMGAAIWSAPPAAMLGFPLRFFVMFFRNHGMLSVNDRPVWRTVVGGSGSYISPMTERILGNIRLNAPVTRITRIDDHAVVECDAVGSRAERFDHVVLACHSDQSLAMLGDPTEAERSVLSALPYQENEAILHTDSSVMPTRRAAWAAWNYHVLKTDSARVPVTYSMNILQGLPTQTQYMVTLNRSEAIDSSKVIRRLRYHHPQYTLKGMQARKRWNTISGVNRTHYCGAYWFNGFHEDGVNSALRVCEHFGEAL